MTTFTTGVPLVTGRFTTKPESPRETESTITEVTALEVLTDVTVAHYPEDKVIPAATIVGFIAGARPTALPSYTIYDGVPQMRLDEDAWHGTMEESLGITKIVVKDDHGDIIHLPVGAIKAMSKMPGGILTTADLHDETKEDPIPDEELNPGDYEIRVIGKNALDDAYEVDIFGTDFRSFTRDEDKIGNWAGIRFYTPVGAKAVKVKEGATYDEVKEPSETRTIHPVGPNGETGFTWWINVSAKATTKYFGVQWDEEDPVVYMANWENTTFVKDPAPVI